MSVATARKDELFIAVGAAVLLHGAAFLVLVLLALAEILIESDKPVPKPKPPEPAVVEISPDYFQAAVAAAPPAPLAPLAAPEEPPTPDMALRAVTTAPEQETEFAPDQPAFIGERNTQAASEQPADANGEKFKPSTDGAEPRRPGEMTTFNSKFNEGEEPGARASVPTPAEPLAGTKSETPDGEKDPDQPIEPEELKTEVESGRPKESAIESANEVSVEVKEGEVPEEKEEALPKEKVNDSESQAAKRGEEGTAETPPQERPKKPGYKTEAKKTRMRGAVSRRGQAALDVEDTAVGRYYSSVKRALENEWQKRCMQRREHLLPGILTLRFIVNEKGGVKHMRFLDEVGASEIQKGITLNSVRYASIPVMPKKVAKELDGEPLELIISFHF